ncbi:MAG: hypothetical protein FWD73_15695 [Polyangiaceae bacterium]|nr:hypothetical protein [Polyangiaceae bacterium]
MTSTRSTNYLVGLVRELCKLPRDRAGRFSSKVVAAHRRYDEATEKEHVETRGYAAGFKTMITVINGFVPSNEVIGQAFRKTVPMYPEPAVRELVANALIHQDFFLTGTGPMVEIFADRVEVTNPGAPLIDPQRFIDSPPTSRNEKLASFMRRVNICEERGTGIDKVVASVEIFQLPAPDFRVYEHHTKAVLFAPMKYGDMRRADRIRACYQHACLQWVSGGEMSNATLRKRFGIEERNYATVSRVIAETLDAKLIRPADPDNKSKKHARYVPFWA